MTESCSATPILALVDRGRPCGSRPRNGRAPASEPPASGYPKPCIEHGRDRGANRTLRADPAFGSLPPHRDGERAQPGAARACRQRSRGAGAQSSIRRTCGSCESAPAQSSIRCGIRADPQSPMRACADSCAGVGRRHAEVDTLPRRVEYAPTPSSIRQQGSNPCRRCRFRRAIYLT